MSEAEASYHEVPCPDCGKPGLAVEKRRGTEVVGVSRTRHECTRTVKLAAEEDA